MAIRAACGVMKIQWTRSGGSRMGEWERSWKYNGIYSQPLNLGLFENVGRTPLLCSRGEELLGNSISREKA
jgi:hypothetical protein